MKTKKSPVIGLEFIRFLKDAYTRQTLNVKNQMQKVYMVLKDTAKDESSIPKEKNEVNKLRNIN